MIWTKFCTNCSSKISLTFYKPYLINGSFKHPTRHLAYVSNKRITRLNSNYELNQDELSTEGNERFVQVRLRNRNPRNLEQMLTEPKPMGFEMQQPNGHYWNKVVLEKKSKHLIGKIIHHSGRTLVSASSNEPSLSVILGSSNLNRTDVRSAVIIGQVLAMRALQAGIHSVFCDPKEYGSIQNQQAQTMGKVSTFIKALADNGLNLNEQAVIFARAQRDH